MSRWIDLLLQIPEKTLSLYLLGGTIVLILLALVLQFRRRRRGSGCRTCDNGYRLEGLTLAKASGREICLRCPACGSFYAKETTGPRVLRVDASYVRNRT